jgi:hypothetical protein
MQGRIADGSSKAKAIIWIWDKMGNRYGWGAGITDGYGYYPESDAIQDAFQDMGYENTLLVKFTP